MTALNTRSIYAHVHVFKGKKSEQNKLEMKISIGTETVAPKLIEANSKLKNQDIVKAIQLVAENQQFLLTKWEEIHGNEMA